MIVRKSLPYLGLGRNNPEANRKIVDVELERYKRFQKEAEEQGMELQPCLEGYNFIHKTDKGKNYFKPSGRGVEWLPAEDIATTVENVTSTYDRDIDVSMMNIEKEKK